MFAGLRERYRFALFSILHRRSLSAQRKWQDKHLRQIVAHAHKNVPMWRSVFAKHGVNPGAIKGCDDLGKLPVTNKELYIGKMAEEYTDSSAPAPSYWYVTSGTSGMPFTFLMGRHARDTKYTDFASLRFLWWLGEPLSRITTINLARIKIRARTSKHRFFLSVEDYLRDPRNALLRLKEFRPEVIGTYPSLLLDMAQLVESNPELLIPELKYAMSFGETLVPSVRNIVEKNLHCEIYDRYGLEEIGAVGVECKEHDGFHVNTESVIVEILDQTGNTAPEKTEGRIVVTDLHNYSMPFIRYDSGDSGNISNLPCACGLRSPRIWVKGRYSAYLNFPKRKIHHLEFDAAMDTYMNYVLRYQIAKTDDREICARIVKGPAFNSDVVDKIEKSLTKLVGRQIRVRVETVKDIPITERGKSKIVIDESQQR